jgi:hypothetical protein
MSLAEAVFDMQPLSRVRPGAMCNWGAPDNMTTHPKVAVRIAECIAECADIETMLGLLLALLLDTNAKAALAMYGSVENRAVQRRMMLAAAEANLPSSHFDLLSVTLSASVSPVMKERDKLAHWIWGHSPELPEALLLTEPDEKMSLHYAAIHRKITGAPESPFNPANIFVVKEDDLLRLASRLRKAKEHITYFMATVWKENTPQKRDEFLQKLSNEPQIREALARLHEARRKTQATP